MCTNGRPTNSVKPPVSFCRAERTQDVPGPVDGLLDRPEHDRDVASQADLVGDAMCLEPLVGGDLVRTQDRPDVVVEDLGRRAWQRRQSGILESGQVVRQRLVEPLGALGHLERGERRGRAAAGVDSLTARTTST